MGDKKEEIKKQETGIRYVVMPKEFKKMAPKKISPKIFLIIGGALVLAGISVAAVLFFTKQKEIPVAEKPQQETPIEEENTPPEEVAATSTEEGSLLEPIAIPEEVEVTPIEQIITKLIPGTDADADGLTDKEEVIYQTDPTRPDTDGDGFLDGNEVFHLYNPAAPPPVTLLESGIVKLYRNASYGYTVYYPTLWSASSTISMSELDFVSDDAESLKIFVEDVDANTSLRNWYMAKYPSADINSLQSYSSKQGYQGLQDTERLNTYIKKGSKVFTLAYDLGGTDIVWYRALYGMIINSLVIE